MKRKNAFRSGRKGFTLTEVIVAMAVVLLITGAAMSVVIASAKADDTYVKRQQAISSCQDAVDCVRFADDVTMLEEALQKVGFGEPEISGGVITFPQANGDTCVLVRVTEGTESNIYVVIYNDEVIYEKIK